MKTERIISLAAVAAVLMICTASCSNSETFNNLLSRISGTKAVPAGEDYIDYPNSKRSDVLSAYLGAKLKSTETTVHLDNIELTYYEVDSESNTYTVYIDNHDPDYFFDGIVRLMSDDKEYDINIDMIAPDNYECFDLEIEGVPDDYQYYAEGEMYSWNEGLSIDYSFEEEALENDMEKLVIIDEPVIDEAMLKDFADYFYKRDTIYNNVQSVTYYLVTSDDYAADGQKGSVVSMYIDTQIQKAEVADLAGTIVLSMSF
ncbi:MAG: hypothetical protein WCG21_09930 [Eubacteriales bacterium]